MSDLRSIVGPNGGPFTLDGTTTYLVGTRRVAILDPGPESEPHLEAILSAVEDADEVVVLVTHDHSDHSEAAPALAARSGARILGTGKGAEPLTEGDEVETDAGGLVAVETPGHASPHLSFHWPERGAVFVGDLLLGKGDTTWLGEYSGCVADYLSSLDRVEALAPSVLYPAHGPPLRDAPGALHRYRRHRHDRLAELRRIRIAHPHESPSELTDRLYGSELSPRIRKAAGMSVEAMLHHLDEPVGAEAGG